MWMIVVALAAVMGFSFAANCDCDCTIYDKDSGINYLASELLDLINELRAKVANCDTNGANECDMHPPNKSWLSEGCTKKNVCFNNRKYTNDMQCPANSFCGTNNGAMSCVCNDGFQWNDQMSDCVAQNKPQVQPSQGACKDVDGKIYTQGGTVLVNGCQQLKLCLLGKLYTQGYECPANSFCGTEGSAEACVCNGGFKWDANKKNCIR
ncbi:hypothetical protein QR680_000653 [Steinernema hermaphroditum]|uniref:Uncharacterized protein n=1 Tax=Steinernema hermaphroditum TaxID=289476 RepID=A0AA39GVH7_9BILA|nr:hypothetical protein QR680_000653 [Steinernema hermaphroditum]